jgi:prolyl-tRNA synthetase
VALDRLLTMAVESSNDKDGMILQSGVAPFDVIVTALDPGAESLYAELAAAGIDVLLDDRDERPGVKFKDADLIGVPWRITVGRKFAGGVVEVVERRTRVVREMPAAETTEFLIRYLA